MLDNSGKSPLHLAIAKHNYEHTEILLEYAANPNIKDNSGQSPVHMVSSKSHYIGLYQEMLRLLKFNGANLGIKNSENQTIFDLLKIKTRCYNPKNKTQSLGWKDSYTEEFLPNHTPSYVAKELERKSKNPLIKFYKMQNNNTTTLNIDAHHHSEEFLQLLSLAEHASDVFFKAKFQEYINKEHRAITSSLSKGFYIFHQISLNKLLIAPLLISVVEQYITKDNLWLYNICTSTSDTPIMVAMKNENYYTAFGLIYSKLTY